MSGISEELRLNGDVYAVTVGFSQGVMKNSSKYQLKFVQNSNQRDD